LLLLGVGGCVLHSRTAKGLPPSPPRQALCGFIGQGHSDRLAVKLPSQSLSLTPTPFLSQRDGWFPSQRLGRSPSISSPRILPPPPSTTSPPRVAPPSAVEPPTHRSQSLLQGPDLASLSAGGLGVGLVGAGQAVATWRRSPGNALGETGRHEGGDDHLEVIDLQADAAPSSASSRSHVIGSLPHIPSRTAWEVNGSLEATVSLQPELASPNAHPSPQPRPKQSLKQERGELLVSACSSRSATKPRGASLGPASVAPAAYDEGQMDATRCLGAAGATGVAAAPIDAAGSLGAAGGDAKEASQTEHMKQESATWREAREAELQTKLAQGRQKLERARQEALDIKRSAHQAHLDSRQQGATSASAGGTNGPTGAASGAVIGASVPKKSPSYMSTT